MRIFKRKNNNIQKEPIVNVILNSGSFLEFRWDGDLSKLDNNKIYAYYSPKYGGIYKTMELYLNGNIDFKHSLTFKGNHKYFGFVRIDNKIGYCQFMYRTMQKLFEHHMKSLHNEYEIYVFDNTRQFYQWCLTFDKLC